jgi:hypothetical protein
MAAVRLDLAAEPGPSDAPGVHLVATNNGDEPASAVTPEVLYQRGTWTAESVRLAPGDRHAWRIVLPPPSRPGTVPATVHVRFLEPGGRTASAPAVIPVGTPGAPPSLVEVTLSAAPLARVGSIRVRLANRGPSRVAGRVVLVLPRDLEAEPESQAAEVEGTASTTLPWILDASGARAGVAYPVWAVFEYAASGVQHSVIARTTVERRDAGEARRVLVVGGLALAAALGLLGLALRASRRHAAQS